MRGRITLECLGAGVHLLCPDNPLDSSCSQAVCNAAAYAMPMRDQETRLKCLCAPLLVQVGLPEVPYETVSHRVSRSRAPAVEAKTCTKFLGACFHTRS